MKMPTTFFERETGQEPVLQLYTEGLTQGSIATFLSCPTLFTNKYLYGYRRAKGVEVPLEFGNVVHAALESLYAEWWSNRLDGLEKYIEEHIANSLAIYVNNVHATKFLNTAQEIDNVYWIHALALKTCIRYLDIYHSDFDGSVDWIGLEHSFTHHITTKRGNIIPIRGKYDGLFRTSKGTPKLFDTKTKGRFTEAGIYSILQYDLQMKLYTWAVSEIFNERIRNVVYNVILRTALRRRKDENDRDFLIRIENDMLMRPKEYFFRAAGTYTDNEISKFYAELVEIVSALETFILDGPSYKALSNCVSFTGFTCDFVDLCHDNNTTLYEKRERPTYKELE